VQNPKAFELLGVSYDPSGYSLVSGSVESCEMAYGVTGGRLTFKDRTKPIREWLLAPEAMMFMPSYIFWLLQVGYFNLHGSGLTNKSSLSPEISFFQRCYFQL
jgi:hypothetical protein